MATGNASVTPPATSGSHRIGELLRLMRPRQWAKNVFVAAPLFLSGNLLVPEAFLTCALATGLFCLVSGGIYVFNDIRDLPQDRVHPKKRFRPLAAGTVPVSMAWGLLAVLASMVAGAAAITSLPRAFWWVIGIYAVNSIAYSVRLKHVSLVELFVLASGYVLRVLAGCWALEVEPSQWLLVSTAVLALLMAAGKRRAEIAEGHDPDKNRRSLHGYNERFLDSMITMLAATALVSYLMFTVSDYAAKRFGNDLLMVTAVFVGLGLLRYMQMTKAGKGADSPTDLVLQDTMLLAAVGGWTAVFAFVLYLS